MTLSYTLRDAERWAAFSGDYNPIHFDAAEARRLGMDGLCVHGMRAMLDVKSALSQAMGKNTLSSEDLLFSCRLREPVLCDIAYQLPVNETEAAGSTLASGKLLNAQTRSASISCKLSESGGQVPAHLTPTDTLSSATLEALYEHFQNVGIKAAPLWSFYDALLFRLLINAPETLETVQRIIPQHNATSLKDVFSLVQVVQTHHETRFPRQMLRHAGEKTRFESLHYAIQPTLIMGEKETGLVLVAGIQAWRADESPIAVAVTLKTGPLAA